LLYHQPYGTDGNDIGKHYNVYDQSRDAQIAYADKKGIGLIDIGALSIPGLPAENPVFREKSSAQGYNPYRNRAEIYPAQDKV
jgi:hypothetical protein